MNATDNTGTDRDAATRTINRRVITTAWLPFEKCPALLYKIFRLNLCRKLGFKLAYALFQCGVLCFKVRYLLFECCCLLPDKGEMFVQHGSRAVLHNQLIEVFNESHKSKRAARTPNY